MGRAGTVCLEQRINRAGLTRCCVSTLYIDTTRFWSLERLHLISGLILFLAITVPWFITVSLANPEFFQFFFIHEHFARFLTKVHARYHPWYSFIPILLLAYYLGWS